MGEVALLVKDRVARVELEAVHARVRLKPRELADVIFNAGSVLLSSTPSGAVRSDCKRYEEAARAFSVSQIEELGFDVFMEKSDALLEALEAYRAENGLYFSALLVTDINTQNSLLLVKGAHEFLDAITYPMREPGIFDLPGIVSRKKQLIPYLAGLLAPKAA
jgi:manganese-dependent inorganic pyrophosphatase